MKKQLKIETNYEDVLKEVIQFCNKMYKSDFRIIDKIESSDGNYVIVEYEVATDENVYNLGCKFGYYLTDLRAKGEIK